MTTRRGGARSPQEMSAGVIAIAALTMCASFTLPAAAPRVQAPATPNAMARMAGEPSAVVFTPGVFARFPEPLRQAKVDFSERLATGAPVRALQGWYFGAGCSARGCGEDEAAWVLDAGGRSAAAVIMFARVDPGMSGVHERFLVFGATAPALPAPLAAWARERGLTAANSLVVGASR